MDGVILSAQRKDTEPVWTVDISQTLEEKQPLTMRKEWSDEQLSAVLALAIGELPPEKAELNAMLYDIAEPACAGLSRAHRPIP